jgi:hypothetical protein
MFESESKSIEEQGSNISGFVGERIKTAFVTKLLLSGDLFRENMDFERGRSCPFLKELLLPIKKRN